MGKVNNMYDQMENVSKKVEKLKTYQKEIWNIKNIATEMNNDFDSFISWCNKAEERMKELKDRWIEISQLETRTTTKKINKRTIK